MALSDEQKARVRELREQNVSYGKITKELGLSKGQVSTWCTKNGLAGYLAGGTSEHDKDLFLQSFNQRHGDRFEYISGYNGCDSYITIKCRTCGQLISKNAQMARRDRKVICTACSDVKRESRNAAKEVRYCEICKNKISRNGKTCSPKCSKERQVRLRQKKFVPQLKACKECGVFFITEFRREGRGLSEFCCDDCKHKAKRRSERIGEYNREKRLRAAFVAKVVPKEIFIRDGLICKLCGEPLAMKKKVPHPLAPTIDHIIPLAKGGTHEPSNVQAAHFECNWIKNDSLPGEASNSPLPKITSTKKP